jgi:hypothetical protein
MALPAIHSAIAELWKITKRHEPMVDATWSAKR